MTGGLQVLGQHAARGPHLFQALLQALPVGLHFGGDGGHGSHRVHRVAKHGQLAHRGVEAAAGRCPIGMPIFSRQLLHLAQQVLKVTGGPAGAKGFQANAQALGLLGLAGFERGQLLLDLGGAGGQGGQAGGYLIQLGAYGGQTLLGLRPKGVRGLGDTHGHSGTGGFQALLDAGQAVAGLGLQIVAAALEGFGGGGEALHPLGQGGLTAALAAGQALHPGGALAELVEARQ